MNSEPLIQVDHLSRDYAGLIAVDDISFALARGEVLGFLGPNGAGKSTTMNMLTGNLAPSAGSIHIGSHDLLDNPKLAKAVIGYLPEQPPVYKEFSVDEYLRFCARINRILPTQIATAVRRAKQRCGLEQVGRRLIGNLSKGYQQRVGIAQAIIHSPTIVVLDEPTVGLDPIQIREIRQLIRDLGQEHGVILSTHILPEVQMTCDRVQIISSGKLVFSDTIENLDQHMQSSKLIVGLHNPPASEALAALPGVTEVEQLSPSRLRLHHTPEASPAEDLVEQAVRQGWGLFELSPERKNLEQIFVEITSKEDVAMPAPTGKNAA